MGGLAEDVSPDAQLSWGGAQGRNRFVNVRYGGPFQIRACRRGADTVRTADESVADTAREGGEEAVKELPNIGEGIARVIACYVRTRRSDVLERLKGEVAPEEPFTQVPGIGEGLWQHSLSWND